MIKIKLLSALTAQTTSAILTYSDSELVNGEVVADLSAAVAIRRIYAKSAELINREVVTDLSAGAVIRRINTDVTFSVLTGDAQTCIIHSNISEAELVSKLDGGMVSQIGPALFRAELLSMPLVEKLLNDPAIIDIQTNTAPVSLMAFPTQTSVVKPGTDVYVDLASLTAVTVSAAGLGTDDWALPRIFNRTLPYAVSTNRFNPIHPALTNIYLMDSGVNSSHTEFNNNVQDLYTIISGDFADNTGHGTQLASAMIGKTVGVAPEFVNVKNVKIFDASRTTTLEDLIGAFQAIADDVAANPGNHVVNMSWVISKNAIVEHLIQSLMGNYGIKFVCAAGNSGQPIELLTPASMTSVITTGAIDNTDTICGFTNYNTAATDPAISLFTETSVDVFAPGFNCKVANHLDVTGHSLTTGTSVASAYVAAVAAYTSLLLYPKIATQADLYTAVVEYSTKELISMTDPKYSLMPNRIVWCLNDCPETKMPKITVVGPKKNWEVPVPDLNKLPEENAVAQAIYNAISLRRDTLYDDTNFSWYGSNFLPANKSYQGVILSGSLTPDSVLKPIVSYAINNNYFSQFELEHVLIEADPLDISLQYKTTGSGDACSYQCYYTGCQSAKCFIWYQLQHYTWTNSIANGYIQTWGACSGNNCDVALCPGCCSPAC